MTGTPQQTKRILLCVTGLSPQIVTETLYALCVSKQEAWIPHEVRLITTQMGAEKAKSMLLESGSGWFHRLCSEWNLPPILFDASHIEVIRTTNGLPLEDIRDDIDNQHAADGIADLIRKLTANDNSEIHASIAGGRKTMGFFMGYAMSLWGRPQDKLSHVLISSPFESRPEFFYPSRVKNHIPSSKVGQDTLDTSSAKVWLGDIPFVRLRNLLPPSIKNQTSGFAQAVLAANRALDQIELHIDVNQSCIRINNQVVNLPPMQWGLLVLLAWRCQRQLSPLRAPNKEVDDPEWRISVRQQLVQAIGEMNIPNSLDRRLNQSKPLGGMVSEQLSKMEKTLRNTGLLPIGRLITRENIGIRFRQQGYQLSLLASHIKITRY